MFVLLLLSVINMLQAARAQWPVLTLNHSIPSAHLNLSSTQHLNTNGTVYVAHRLEKHTCHAAFSQAIYEQDVLFYFVSLSVTFNVV